MSQNYRYDPGVNLVVAGALFDGKERVYVQKRPDTSEHGGLWEFPGGKVEPGETPSAALVRELREELQIEIDPDDLTPCAFSETQGRDRPMALLLFAVFKWHGAIDPAWSESVRWVGIDELRTLAMPPADVPLIATVEQILRSGPVAARQQFSPPLPPSMRPD